MSGKIGATVLGVAIVAGAVGTMMCTERISAGYVGVRYSLSGGIKDDVLGQGYHVISPLESVTKYSVATEQLYMSKDKKEGSEDDDSFDVVCKDGKMNVDLELSYSFDPDRVADVFKKYRGMSGETVMHDIIRGKIKTYISEVTSKYTVLEAYMGKKAQLNKDITEYLREKLDVFGVTIESATISRASVDESIAKAITDRSRTAQELEVEKQKQEKAKLQAETALIEAKGKAEKLAIQTEAEAKRNKEISESITPELLKKWEMDARKEHGWITVSGANTVVTK